MQLHHVDETLGPCQALGEVEAGAEIPSGDVDDLAVEDRGALAGGVEGFCSEVVTEASNASVERS
ncbi:MAG: hypothetical protein WBW37_09600 [Methyloceanibacter sp.]